MAAATKTHDVGTWADLSAASGLESSAIDVSTTLDAAIVVTVCPIEAVANALGALVIVQVRTSTEDDDWHNLYEIRLGAGTANTIDVDQESAQDTATLFLSATANFDGLFQRFFSHHSSPADSQIVTGISVDTDVSIGLLDNLVHTQPNTANVYDIVAEKLLPLPQNVSTARVLIVNDDADCDVAVKIDVERMTAIG